MGTNIGISVSVIKAAKMELNFYVFYMFSALLRSPYRGFDCPPHALHRLASMENLEDT